MYVIQPSWLKRAEILDRDVQVSISSRLEAPGFRYQSKQLRSRWYVSPSKLEVQTDDPGEDCGYWVGRVLEKLPWTPLSAIGNNTIYVAALADLDAVPAIKGFWPAPPEGYTCAQRTTHLTVGRGPHVFNLQIAVGADDVELAVNVHTELDMAEPSDLAVRAARQFLEHRTEAEKLVRDLFRVDIDHANPNPLPA